MVKRDTELKLFHSMIKYNDLFIAPGINGSVITFMGDLPLEGMKWHFPLTLDGREQLHSLSIKSLEKIPRPIFAARSPLRSSAKLLNLW